MLNGIPFSKIKIQENKIKKACDFKGSSPNFALLLSELVNYYSPWNYQKTAGEISGGIEVKDFLTLSHCKVTRKKLGPRFFYIGKERGIGVWKKLYLWYKCIKFWYGKQDQNIEIRIN